MKYTSFQESRFQSQVDNALISVKRILDTTRNPRLAGNNNGQDHSYEDKYALAAWMTNTALVATVNVFELLGMTSDHLSTMNEWKNANKSVTLRFEAIQTCKFMQEREVPFVAGSTSTVIEVEKQSSGRFFGKSSSEKSSTKSKVTTMIKEYHWKVRINYKLIAFAGASPDDGAGLVTWQSRDASTILVIKGTEKVPFLNVFKHPPIDVDLTWLLSQIMIHKQQHVPQQQTAQFRIDRNDPHVCKTPRRNPHVDQAVEAFQDICHFAQKLRQFLLIKVEREILSRHSPVNDSTTDRTTANSKLTSIHTRNLYNPILPLMESKNNANNSTAIPRRSSHPPVKSSSLVTLTTTNDTNNNDTTNTPLLSLTDMEKFLGEQLRTVQEAILGLANTFLPKGNGEHLISTAEATLVLLASHLEQLAFQYEDCMRYMEHMLQQQLIFAIGKHVHAPDFDDFMKFYYQHKLYAPQYAPTPFCVAIRRPGYYPDGILSIEYNNNNSDQQQPIDTFCRRITPTCPMQVPLTAATTVSLNGDCFLHGWMQHRFQNNGTPGNNSNKCYQLAARARQFSCFMVIVGTIAGPNKFSPQSAILLQNKDEVLIPLLLEELPTAKEFQDAISSLSPEQQQFAKAFREMQLESSVFGVAVVQLKPQLEDLLGLPPGSLTKEMQLTQDLLSLFIEYQIPSDLLSYDGPPEEPDRSKKIALVQQYTKSVLNVVQGEKDKQLALEKQKAHMALEQYAQGNPSVLFDEALSAVSEEASLASSIPTTIMEPVVYNKKKLKKDARSVYSSPAALASQHCEAHSFVGAYSVSAPFDASSMPGCTASGGGGLSQMEQDLLAKQRGAGPRTMGLAPPGAMAVSGSSMHSTVSNSAADELPPGPIFDGPSGPGGPSGAALKSPSTQPQQPLLSPQDGNAEASDDEEGTLDFTKIPKQLDAKFEVHDKDNSLRATIIKASDAWQRKRQENLLVKVGELQSMYPDEIKSEKDKAFDLLDALTRSGSLPLSYSELHVIVAVTHCFENDVMGAVIEDNINPIAKVEKSSLMIASTVHGVPSPGVLLRNTEHVGRLQQAFPALFDGES